MQPKTYKNNSLSLNIKNVTDEKGTPKNYTTSTSNDNLVLKIGDANTYVHGQQTYVINYTLKNVVTFYGDHDEWYWDINGDEWGQVTHSVTSTITLDDTIASNILPDKKCFTGSYGSKESDCQIDSDGNKIKVYSNRTFSPKENLSFVLGFKPNTFSPEPTNWARIIFFAITIFKEQL